jgi:hypothetical protein
MSSAYGKRAEIREKAAASKPGRQAAASWMKENSYIRCWFEICDVDW